MRRVVIHGLEASIEVERMKTFLKGPGTHGNRGSRKKWAAEREKTNHGEILQLDQRILERARQYYRNSPRKRCNNRENEARGVNLGEKCERNRKNGT